MKKYQNIFQKCGKSVAAWANKHVLLSLLVPEIEVFIRTDIYTYILFKVGNTTNLVTRIAATRVTCFK